MEKTLCEICDNRKACVAPCSALEALISKDHVGYGKRGVFVQNAVLPEGTQNDWIDWMNLKEGVEFPKNTIDMEVFDNLSVPIPDHLKRTLMLFFVEGMSLTDIALQEDVSKNAIRKRIGNAGKLIAVNMQKRRYFYLDVMPNRSKMTDRQYYVGKAYYRDMRSMSNVANDLGTSLSNVHQVVVRVKAICRIG